MQRETLVQIIVKITSYKSIKMMIMFENLNDNISNENTIKNWYYDKLENNQ